MIDTQETRIVKDPSGKKLIVTRYFAAPLTKVWRAWTESRYLDEWWAPKPWRAETKDMNFAVGGRWLYSMVGPNNERHWCLVAFQAIEPQKSMSVQNGFCDENGKLNTEFPEMKWYTKFASDGNGTNVSVEITFNSEADLQKIVEMGFKEGFSMALSNLDELLPSL